MILLWSQKYFINSLEVSIAELRFKHKNVLFKCSAIQLRDGILVIRDITTEMGDKLNNLKVQCVPGYKFPDNNSSEVCLKFKIHVNMMENRDYGFLFDTLNVETAVDIGRENSSSLSLAITDNRLCNNRTNGTNIASSIATLKQYMRSISCYLIVCLQSVFRILAKVYSRLPTFIIDAVENVFASQVYITKKILFVCCLTNLSIKSVFHIKVEELTVYVKKYKIKAVDVLLSRGPLSYKLCIADIYLYCIKEVNNNTDIGNELSIAKVRDVLDIFGRLTLFSMHANKVQLKRLEILKIHLLMDLYVLLVKKKPKRVQNSNFSFAIEKVKVEDCGFLMTTKNLKHCNAEWLVNDIKIRHSMFVLRKFTVTLNERRLKTSRMCGSLIFNEKIEDVMNNLFTMGFPQNNDSIREIISFCSKHLLTCDEALRHITASGISDGYAKFINQFGVIDIPYISVCVKESLYLKCKNLFLDQTMKVQSMKICRNRNNLFQIHKVEINMLCLNVKRLNVCMNLKLIENEAKEVYEIFDVIGKIFNSRSSGLSLIVNSQTNAPAYATEGILPSNINNVSLIAPSTAKNEGLIPNVQSIIYLLEKQTSINKLQIRLVTRANKYVLLAYGYKNFKLSKLCIKDSKNELKASNLVMQHDLRRISLAKLKCKLTRDTTAFHSDYNRYCSNSSGNNKMSLFIQKLIILHENGIALTSQNIDTSMPRISISLYLKERELSDKIMKAPITKIAKVLLKFTQNKIKASISAWIMRNTITKMYDIYAQLNKCSYNQGASSSCICRLKIHYDDFCLSGTFEINIVTDNLTNHKYSENLSYTTSNSSNLNTNSLNDSSCFSTNTNFWELSSETEFDVLSTLHMDTTSCCIHYNGFRVMRIEGFKLSYSNTVCVDVVRISFYYSPIMLYNIVMQSFSFSSNGQLPDLSVSISAISYSSLTLINLVYGSANGLGFKMFYEEKQDLKYAEVVKGTENSVKKKEPEYIVPSSNLTSNSILQDNVSFSSAATFDKLSSQRAGSMQSVGSNVSPIVSTVKSYVSSNLEPCITSDKQKESSLHTSIHSDNYRAMLPSVATVKFQHRKNTQVITISDLSLTSSFMSFIMSEYELLSSAESIPFCILLYNMHISYTFTNYPLLDICLPFFHIASKLSRGILSFRFFDPYHLSFISFLEQCRMKLVFSDTKTKIIFLEHLRGIVSIDFIEELLENLSGLCNAVVEFRNLINKNRKCPCYNQEKPPVCIKRSEQVQIACNRIPDLSLQESISCNKLSPHISQGYKKCNIDLRYGLNNYLVVYLYNYTDASICYNSTIVTQHCLFLDYYNPFIIINFFRPCILDLRNFGVHKFESFTICSRMCGTYRVLEIFDELVIVNKCGVQINVTVERDNVNSVHKKQTGRKKDSPITCLLSANSIFSLNLASKLSVGLNGFYATFSVAKPCVFKCNLDTYTIFAEIVFGRCVLVVLYTSLVIFNKTPDYLTLKLQELKVSPTKSKKFIEKGNRILLEDVSTVHSVFITRSDQNEFNRKSLTIMDQEFIVSPNSLKHIYAFAESYKLILNNTPVQLKEGKIGPYKLKLEKKKYSFMGMDHAFLCRNILVIEPIFIIFNGINEDVWINGEFVANQSRICCEMPFDIKINGKKFIVRKPGDVISLEKGKLNTDAKDARDDRGNTRISHEKSPQNSFNEIKGYKHDNYLNVKGASILSSNMRCKKLHNDANYSECIKIILASDLHLVYKTLIQNCTDHKFKVNNVILSPNSTAPLVARDVLTVSFEGIHFTIEDLETSYFIIERNYDTSSVDEAHIQELDSKIHSSNEHRNVVCNTVCNSNDSVRTIGNVSNTKKLVEKIIIEVKRVSDDEQTKYLIRKKTHWPYKLYNLTNKELTFTEIRCENQFNQDGIVVNEDLETGDSISKILFTDSDTLRNSIDRVDSKPINSMSDAALDDAIVSRASNCSNFKDSGFKLKQETVMHKVILPPNSIYYTIHTILYKSIQITTLKSTTNLESGITVTPSHSSAFTHFIFASQVLKPQSKNILVYASGASMSVVDKEGEIICVHVSEMNMHCTLLSYSGSLESEKQPNRDTIAYTNSIYSLLSSYHYKLTIGKLQVDNQELKCVYPILLYPEDKSHQYKSKPNARKFLHATVTCDTTGISNLYLAIKKVIINLEEKTLNRLTLCTSGTGMGGVNIGKIKIERIKASVSYVVNEDKMVKRCEMLCMSPFCETEKCCKSIRNKHPTSLCICELFGEKKLGIQNDILKHLVNNLSDYHFDFDPCTGDIYNFYLSQFNKNLYKMLSHLDYLGNLGSLSNSLSLGIKDLISESQKNPAKGLLRGSKSFVQHTLFGISNSIGKISQSVSGLVDKRRSYFHKYVLPKSMSSCMRNDRSVTLSSWRENGGFASCNRVPIVSFSFISQKAVSNTHASTKKKKFFELLSSVGKNIFKPVSSVANLITDASEVIKNKVHKTPRRLQYPRVNVLAYNEIISYAHYSFMRKIKKYDGEQFVNGCKAFIKLGKGVKLHEHLFSMNECDLDHSICSFTGKEKLSNLEKSYQSTDVYLGEDTLNAGRKHNLHDDHPKNSNMVDFGIKDANLIGYINNSLGDVSKKKQGSNKKSLDTLDQRGILLILTSCRLILASDKEVIEAPLVARKAKTGLKIGRLELHIEDEMFIVSALEMSKVRPKN